MNSSILRKVRSPGSLLQHDLIEAEPHVVESHRTDVGDVGGRDIGVEMLEIAFGYLESPFFGQHVEALVVRKPPPYAHAAFKPRPRRRESGGQRREHRERRDRGAIAFSVHFPLLALFVFNLRM